jgi:hypothetical protein
MSENINSMAEYHIHVSPVPTDGNCTGTGGHLDPYQRTDTPACDSTKPQTCEAGDLSGKWGTLTEAKASKRYNNTFSASWLICDKLADEQAALRTPMFPSTGLMSLSLAIAASYFTMLPEPALPAQTSLPLRCLPCGRRLRERPAMYDRLDQ